MSFNANTMRTRIAQWFAKVWTPRTPDSSYDSFGGLIPVLPIVMTPVLSDAMGTGCALENAIYGTEFIVVGYGETPLGSSCTLVSATYTA
jgi:hypothetical protein